MTTQDEYAEECPSVESGITHDTKYLYIYYML